MAPWLPLPFSLHRTMLASQLFLLPDFWCFFEIIMIVICYVESASLWHWGIFLSVCGQYQRLSLLCLLLPPACPIYLTYGHKQEVTCTTLFLDSVKYVQKNTFKVFGDHSSPYLHTALGSLQLWFHSEPKDCLGCGTGPECASLGSHSWDARQHPRETQANQSEHW